jgi:hypothetical protein
MTAAEPSGPDLDGPADPIDPAGPFAPEWRRRHLSVDERMAPGTVPGARPLGRPDRHRLLPG